MRRRPFLFRAFCPFGLVLCLAFAIDATVGTGLSVCQTENVGKLLLGGGDATGVLAFHNVHDLLG